MSTDDVKLLAEKIDGLATRVGALEKAVTALISRTLRHEKVLRWLRTAGLVLLGVAVGSGLVQLNDVAALIGTP
jgi:hypothetical protein